MRPKKYIGSHALRIRLTKSVESYIRLCEKYGDDSPVAIGAQTKVEGLRIKLREWVTV